MLVACAVSATILGGWESDGCFDHCIMIYDTSFDYKHD